MIKKSKKNPEQNLAERVVRWLINDDWDVYQEVRPNPQNSWAIDIVAVKCSVSWAVECKTSFSLEVIAQAIDDVSVAGQVSVAVPGCSNKKRGFAHTSSGRRLAKKILREHGIGLIEIFPTTIRETLKPSSVLNMKELLTSVIKPEHKTHAKAGSNHGGQFTPFRQTSNAITNYIKDHPEGVTIDSLSKNIKHHYTSRASFKFSIAKMIKKQVIKHVKFNADKSLIIPF